MAEGNWGSAGMHKVDIRNDLMFSYVMRNPEICTELLEVLLPGHKIARVEYIELESERDGAPQAAITKAHKNRPDTQKALLSAIDKRGVRLDAYLDDGKTIYNIEMQTAEYLSLIHICQKASRVVWRNPVAFVSYSVRGNERCFAHASYRRRQSRFRMDVYGAELHLSACRKRQHMECPGHDECHI